MMMIIGLFSGCFSGVGGRRRGGERIRIWRAVSHRLARPLRSRVHNMADPCCARAGPATSAPAGMPRVGGALRKKTIGYRPTNFDWQRCSRRWTTGPRREGRRRTCPTPGAAGPSGESGRNDAEFKKFKVMLCAPPNKKSLGVHSYPKNTQCGDPVTVDDGEQFIVHRVVYRYKLFKGRYRQSDTRYGPGL